MIICIISFLFAAGIGSFQFQLEENEEFIDENCKLVSEANSKRFVQKLIDRKTRK
jgi:hypothetical protein